MKNQEQGRRFTTLLAPLHWNGYTDRKTYVTAGFILFAIKFLLDRWVAALYNKTWSGINYIVPNETFSLRTLPPEERGFYLTLATLALPFILIGILLTIRRLRDAGLPLWLSLLFFVPVVNLFFFAVLALIPTRTTDVIHNLDAARTKLAEIPTGEPLSTTPQPDIPPVSRGNALYRTLVRILPESPWGSAAVSCFVLALGGVILTLFGVNVLRNYGWGMFIGAPFCLGLLAAMLHGVPARRDWNQSVLVGQLALLMVCISILVVAIEGFICMLMGLVIALPMTWLGGLVGHFIQLQYPRPDSGDTTTHITCGILFLLPLFMSVENAFAPSPELIPVRTRVIVHASPERVWANVVVFPPLPELKASSPSDWLFLAGIASPIGAKIEGTGVGAIRYCEFTTGPFVEPITVWDAPNLLAFDVIEQPATMKELSPYPDLHPPHLNNFLVSKRGQFRLTRLSDGRTHLEGTTFYQNRMWPGQYWRLWSDHIIHHIHTRVLNHVKAQSERGI